MKQEKIEKEYLIFTEDGKVYSPEEYKFKEGEEDFKILVDKEALGIESKGGSEPEYIGHLKKFGIEWEPMSDSGHMRYGPLGEIIYNLISDYSRQVVNSLGLPVYEVHGTNMFNLDYKPVKEHADLFGDRLYNIEIDKKKFVLRYAACHQQFAMIKDWQISYKHLPFGAFEIADSYRYEQSGELLLCFRLRKFDMPDLHVFCKDLEDSKGWFLRLHRKAYESIKEIGRDYVSLYNLTSKEFFEENKEWIRQLVKFEGKPVLLCFYPKGKNYYWKLNIEYHIVDEMKRPREIGTVQMDVGNAERFDIKFTGPEGKEVRPIILHTALVGGLERYLYAIMDSAVKMKNPMLPVWLSPIQVRIVPVSERFNGEAEKFADELSKSNIRVDIDDRSDTLQKKVRNSEKDWVPYSIVFGEKEIGSASISVRSRIDGKVEPMQVQNLVKMIQDECKGRPFRSLNIPKFLSKRPIFS
jgi:threonyl-tRNA synthetase